jgi:hypothetical protein
MFRLAHRAIIRKKVTKVELLCKTRYLFYSVYARVEVSTYMSQKIHNKPKFYLQNVYLEQ